MSKRAKKILYISLIIIFSLMFIGSSAYLIFYAKSNQDSKDIFNELRDIYNTSEINNTSSYENSEESINQSITEDSTQSTTISQSSEDSNTSNNSTNNSINNSSSIINTKPTTPLTEEQKRTQTIANLQALLKKNKYFVGWIKINGTVIDYPVMQTKFNEEYYIHTNFYNQYSFAGVPFCSEESDLETPSDNIIIYGHNMLNGTMFSDLERYNNKSFYENHKYINFDTIYYPCSKYEIVSIFRSDVAKESYDFYNYVGDTEEDFNRFAKFIKEKSIYSIPTELEYGDKLITLITCTKYFKNDTGRYVVVAKLIDDNNSQ